MGASAAPGPGFLWLQHPSAQQYSHPCSVLAHAAQSMGAAPGGAGKGLGLPGWHLEPRGAQPCQGLLQLLEELPQLPSPEHKDAAVMLRVLLNPNPKGLTEPPLGPFARGN